MHPHYLYVPLIVVLGTIFLVYMWRRNRSNPPAGVARTDDVEPVELRGEEQRKRRRL